jgi:hypothetical protein
MKQLIILAFAAIIVPAAAQNVQPGYSVIATSNAELMKSVWIDGPRLEVPNGTIFVGNDQAKTNASAALEFRGTDAAIVLPRLSTTQRNALTAAEGMFIYNTSLDSLQYRNASTWITMGSGGGGSGYWSSTGNYVYPATLTDSIGIGTDEPGYVFDVQGNTRITNADSTLVFFIDTSSSIIGSPFSGFYRSSGSNLTISGIIDNDSVFVPLNIINTEFTERALSFLEGNILLQTVYTDTFDHKIELDSTGFDIQATSTVTGKSVSVANDSDSTLNIIASSTILTGYFEAINGDNDIIIRTDPTSVELGVTIGGDTAAIFLTANEASIYGLGVTTIGQTGSISRIRGQLLYADGNESAGYVLSSDADGNGSWAALSTLDASTIPAYADNAAAFAAIGAGKLYYTDTGGEYILKISH